MRTTIAIFLILLSFTLNGQDGIPYISHFEEVSDFSVQNWSVCQDGQNVMLFANRLGITSYDGNRWMTSRIQYIPSEIKKHDQSGRIFAGASNNYGILEINHKREITYSSLSGDTADLGIIDRIYFTGSSVCFAGKRSISVHNLDNPEQFRRWYAREGEPFTGFISNGDNIYINVSRKGLHRVDADTLFPIVTGYITEDTEVLFMLGHDSTRILVGTSDNSLKLFDGIKFYPYPLSDEEYLPANILSDAVAVTDSLYAFSTLYGGVLLVNKRDGRVLHLLNYQNGLPDDEIYAIGTDNNNGLWITHGLGISRADLSLPLRNFSNYPGLEGVVTSTQWHGNQLYVSTNEGLWYLDEVRNYREVEVLQKKTATREPERILTQPQLQPLQGELNRSARDETGADQKQETESPKKGILSKIFSRKDKPAEKETEVALPEVQPGHEPVFSREDLVIKPAPQYVLRKVSRLKSIDHIYRKVEGMNARCSKIVETGNGLLVATTAGLFEVNNYVAKQIIPGRLITDIISAGEPGRYFIATDEGIIEISYNGKGWDSNRNIYAIAEPVYSMTYTSENNLWASGNNILFRLHHRVDNNPGLTRTYTFESDFPERSIVTTVNDTLLLLTENGISYFSPDDGLLRSLSTSLADRDEGDKMNFLLSSPGVPWIDTGDGWFCLKRNIEGVERLETLMRLFDKIVSIKSDNNGSFWVTDSKSDIYRISNFAGSEIDPVFNLFINSLGNEEGLFFDLENLEFEPFNNAISVNISAPHYIKETTTQYQYFIEELMKNWSPLSTNPEINLFLKSGSYTVHFRAINILGKMSEVKSISFTIKPPFTRTVWFYLLVSIGAGGFITGLMFARETKLRHDKRILEERVIERTAELEKKREQIEAQRDEILKQKEEITSSITYASRIQDAILPGHKIFRKVFREHFIFFRPRDIVSGDFYWISEVNNRIFYAVADCTGHGVPGAIMSMLGISLLNEITANSDKKLKPGEILALLREKVIFSLKQSGRDDEANDGMDVAFCILDKKNNILEFAGAFNPLYLVRDGVLTEFKADRMPIGYHLKQSRFTDHEIKLKPGDSIYIFTDGYYDQFGGPDDKRFSSRMLKKMLREISDIPMEEQKAIIEKRFRNWKGNQEQVDDILILGIRI